MIPEANMSHILACTITEQDEQIGRTEREIETETLLFLKKWGIEKEKWKEKHNRLSLFDCALPSEPKEDGGTEVPYPRGCLNGHGAERHRVQRPQGRMVVLARLQGMCAVAYHPILFQTSERI